MTAEGEGASKQAWQWGGMKRQRGRQPSARMVAASARFAPSHAPLPRSLAGSPAQPSPGASPPCLSGGVGLGRNSPVLVCSPPHPSRVALPLQEDRGGCSSWHHRHCPYQRPSRARISHGGLLSFFLPSFLAAQDTHNGGKGIVVACAQQPAGEQTGSCVIVVCISQVGVRGTLGGRLGCDQACGFRSAGGGGLLSWGGGFRGAAAVAGVKEFEVASVPGSLNLWEVYGEVGNPGVPARFRISNLRGLVSSVD